MAKVEALATARLHAKCDPARIPWEDSTQIPLSKGQMGRQTNFQPRAMQALDLALKIKASGYNVYVSGDAGLGRTHTVLSYLAPLAKKARTPDDIIYVYNFANPDEPRFFALPPGCGSKVKTLFKEAMTRSAKSSLTVLTIRAT